MNNAFDPWSLLRRRNVAEEGHASRGLPPGRAGLVRHHGQAAVQERQGFESPARGGAGVGVDEWRSHVPWQGQGSSRAQYHHSDDVSSQGHNSPDLVRDALSRAQDLSQTLPPPQRDDPIRQYSSAARLVLSLAVGAVVALFVVLYQYPCLLPLYDMPDDLDLSYYQAYEKHPESSCVIFQKLTAYRYQLHDVLVRDYLGASDQLKSLQVGIHSLDLRDATTAAVRALQRFPELGFSMETDLFQKAVEISVQRHVVREGTYGVHLVHAPSIGHWDTVSTVSWGTLYMIVRAAAVTVLICVILPACMGYGVILYTVSLFRNHSSRERFRHFVYSRLRQARGGLTLPQLHSLVSAQFPDTFTMTLADFDAFLKRDDHIGNTLRFDGDVDDDTIYLFLIGQR
eukprot:TRINITY_DN20485_c0_g1_i1.p1 TRINITY_DN20485_c0_g1~~TRINITY_DN20485_c0_g1_i1.p1  ORF type:complete len:399 (+),score=103.18 TRINITY_DN20485_c0_g1_i1:74-1270(+)